MELCNYLRQQAAEAALNDLPACAEAMMEAADALERLRFAGRSVVKAVEHQALNKRHIEQLSCAMDVVIAARRPTVTPLKGARARREMAERDSQLPASATMLGLELAPLMAGEGR